MPRYYSIRPSASPNVRIVGEQIYTALDCQIPRFFPVQGLNLIDQEFPLLFQI
jgi:hypothetical protein